jgi:hypothetical protein
VIHLGVMCTGPPIHLNQPLFSLNDNMIRFVWMPER